MIKLVHHEMVINSKFLEVPRSYYQRNLNANRVKRIAAEFDERIANAPKVSYRDGHYYVFDGQHTIAARKLLNNNCDLNIVCKVYSGLTEQQEALLFAQQTGVSAPLTAGAKMRAKIRGGDPEAIAFLNATNRAGFGLSFAQSHAKWKIACIATAFAEYRKHGERIYTDALRVLAEAWEGDIDSLRAEVLQGVTQFVALYDHEYDPIRLIRQLQRTSPVAIYRSGQAMTGPNYQKYMLQILKALQRLQSNEKPSHQTVSHLPAHGRFPFSLQKPFCRSAFATYYKGGLIIIVYVTKNFGFRRGEIYFADLDPHYGSEQGGKRPVIVIQNNTGNKFSPTVIVAAVTSKISKKPNQPTHVLIDKNPAFNRPSVVLLEQLFTIDKERINNFMGLTSDWEMAQIEKALKCSLALNQENLVKSNSKTV